MRRGSGPPEWLKSTTIISTRPADLGERQIAIIRFVKSCCGEPISASLIWIFKQIVLQRYDQALSSPPFSGRNFAGGHVFVTTASDEKSVSSTNRNRAAT